jgi:hypothetical protein
MKRLRYDMLMEKRGSSPALREYETAVAAKLGL